MSDSLGLAGRHETDVSAWTCVTNAVANAAGMQFISFAIGNEHYGVDIMSVREIKGCSEIAQLPEQPSYVRGVINLRGAIVPIVDLRCRFAQGVTEATPMHVFIIVQVCDKLVGLLADRVSDIISVESAAIKPIPNLSASPNARFLSGIATVDDDLIALIDLDRLLSAESALQ